MEKIILASGSPRRNELLHLAGIPFETVIPNVDESCSLPAVNAVAILSERKARAVGSEFPGRYILAADTLVSVDGNALGKPHDEADAVRMLHLLSGRTHQVYTSVTFSELSADEIRSYVASGEPMDKAGAYALQGRASLWITRVEGSFSSVIGLPMHLVRELLLFSGYSFERDP